MSFFICKEMKILNLYAGIGGNRNCVYPEVGLHILNNAIIHPVQKEVFIQKSLF